MCQPAIPANWGGGTNAQIPAINVTNAYDTAGIAKTFMGKALTYDTGDRITTPGYTFDTNGNMTATP